MDHNMHDMPPPSSSSMDNTKSPMIMHMTFFWGKNTEVLFSGWPGTSSGMYALCLILVFFAAVITEWLTHSKLLRGGSTNRAAGMVQTAVYTVKTGLAYLVMLAVMSFNGGVFIVAMIGFGVGFFLFGSNTFKKESDLEDDRKNTELIPPSNCVC